MLNLFALAMSLILLSACGSPSSPKESADKNACVLSDATIKAQAESAKKASELRIQVEQRLRDIQIAALDKCVQSGGSPVMVNGNVFCDHTVASAVKK